MYVGESQSLHLLRMKVGFVTNTLTEVLTIAKLYFSAYSNLRCTTLDGVFLPIDVHKSRKLQAGKQYTYKRCLSSVSPLLRILKDQSLCFWCNLDESTLKGERCCELIGEEDLSCSSLLSCCHGMSTETQRLQLNRAREVRRGRLRYTRGSLRLEATQQLPMVYYA